MWSRASFFLAWASRRNSIQARKICLGLKTNSKHVKSMLCLYRSRVDRSTSSILLSSRVNRDIHAHKLLRELYSLAWKHQRHQDDSFGVCAHVATWSTRKVERCEKSGNVHQVTRMPQTLHPVGPRNTYVFIGVFRGACTDRFFFWQWPYMVISNDRFFFWKWLVEAMQRYNMMT